MKTTPLAKEQKQRREALAALVKSKAPLGFCKGEPYYSREELECKAMAENYQRQINDAEFTKAHDQLKDGETLFRYLPKFIIPLSNGEPLFRFKESKPKKLFNFF